jgi:hypothetical protein
MRVVYREEYGNESMLYLTIVKINDHHYHLEYEVKASWGDPEACGEQRQASSIKMLIPQIKEIWLPNDEELQSIIDELEG